LGDRDENISIIGKTLQGKSLAALKTSDLGANLKS
jgi:hypothetical protein